jgi:uncharacterized delta-60 repeat protein
VSRSLAAGLALLAGLGPAAAASADVPRATAPGRVAVLPGSPQPATNVDEAGLAATVGLPDGGAIMARREGRDKAMLFRLLADGRVDTTFGREGFAPVALPAGTQVSDLLRRPDGRLVLVATGPLYSRFEVARAHVIGLTADGKLDRSFGSGGTASPPIQSSCACAPAALAPDGGIVLTGHTGELPPAVAGGPAGSNPNRAWVVARLTASGAPDPAFGGGDGVAELPAPRGGGAGGYAAHVTAGGRLLVVGRAGEQGLLFGVGPDGSVDPAYRGGAPLVLPGPFQRTALRADGGLDVLAGAALTRVDAAGQVIGGPVELGIAAPGFGDVVSAPDGATYVVAARYEAAPASVPRATIVRVGPGGAVERSVGVVSGFGGGLASRQRSVRLPAGGIDQDAFRPGRLLVRPSGGFLLMGGVPVVRYTGEGAGFSLGSSAAVALTDALEVDPSFGGPAGRARATTRLAPRRDALLVGRRARIRVRVFGSAPGLALVRVRDRSGRILAQSVEPVYARGSRTAEVPVTATGTRVLRRVGRGERIRVQVGHAFRDVVGATHTGTSAGELRR